MGTPRANINQQTIEQIVNESCIIDRTKPPVLVQLAGHLRRVAIRRRVKRANSPQNTIKSDARWVRALVASARWLDQSNLLICLFAGREGFNAELRFGRSLVP